MTYTITSPFGQKAADSLEPWYTEDMGRWLNAAGALFDPTLEIVQETGSDGTAGYLPGYGILFDPDECPAAWLPYLGLFVGVKVPVGAPEAEARALVKAESGKERGTLKSIESAVSRSLTGSKAFQIVERCNAKGEEAGYHFLILVYEESELPSETILRENVNAVKPAGVFYTVIVGNLTYAILEAAHTTYSALEAAHTTYSGMEAEPTK